MASVHWPHPRDNKSTWSCKTLTQKAPTMPHNSLTSNAIVARNDDALYSEVADGMSLMDIESGNYYHYDQTGAEVWKALDGTRTVASLCEALRADFDVDAETCLSDTLAFLDELHGLGLVIVK